jgi:hypothetical protein
MSEPGGNTIGTTGLAGWIWENPGPTGGGRGAHGVTRPTHRGLAKGVKRAGGGRPGHWVAVAGNVRTLPDWPPAMCPLRGQTESQRNSVHPAVGFRAGGR